MNKPVAWILETDNSPQEFCWDESELDEITEVYDMEGWNYKVYPVYTNPVKELTDEEIQAIAKESYVWNTGKQEWSEIEFAKAILRKAQEK